MMNTMVVQPKEMMTHISHQIKVGGPGVPLQPGMGPTGMVGMNGDINHVKRPMNAFMVSILYQPLI